MLTLAGGCLFAGFLIGLLIFGAPWHLPPAWGDIPAWFLVVLTAIGGGAARASWACSGGRSVMPQPNRRRGRSLKGTSTLRTSRCLVLERDPGEQLAATGQRHHLPGHVQGGPAHRQTGEQKAAKSFAAR